jgi:hypothetical protein
MFVQSNAPIRPFRKKGWDLLPKLETILPVSGAKGRHVFVASATASTSQTLANELGITGDEEDELPDVIKAAGSRKIGGDGKIDGGDGKIDGGDGKIGDGNAMDVDEAPTLSVSSSKQKHSALLDNTPISLLSSEVTSPSGTTSMTPSEPASKKLSDGKGKQSAGKSALKISSAQRKPSSSKVTKITNTTVLHGMQGTMNRVTDIFEKSVMQPLDPQSAVRSDVLHYVQTREDDLSLNERTALVKIFMKDYIAAETYVALVNDDLRRSWLAAMLKE